MKIQESRIKLLTNNLSISQRMLINNTLILIDDKF